MDELVCIGKIINFFGIKGELKVLSDFDKKDKAFKIGMHVLINNEEFVISSIRKHKNYILITINNMYDINLITKYIGYNIYVKMSDLNLKENEYLLEELINSKVMDDGVLLGEVIDIINSNNCSYVKVLYNKKEYLIPLVDAYIKSFDKRKKILNTINAKDLII